MLYVCQIDEIAEGVAGVMVGGDKITGDLVCFAEGQKRRDPLAGAGGGAADAETLVHALDSPCRCFVELKIVLLCSGEEAAKIRLVPNLEIPALHLLSAVTVKEKADKAANIVAPRGKRFRHGDVGVIGKPQLFAACES